MAKRKQDPGERISEAEHAVMEALWEKSPLTAADVCDSVCEERGWSMPTVKTLLSRLVAKGAVRKGRPVKVLGQGDISVAVQVTADKFSGTAKEKIAAAGGTATER